MNNSYLTAKELMGLRVVTAKNRKKDPEGVKRVGKVRACVFHPTDRKFVGLMVHRPDLALMFHRRDVFVAYNKFQIVDGRVLIEDDAAATDSGACKALGINLDDCILWSGLPVMTQDGNELGIVGNVTFDRDTGAVSSLEVSGGVTANTLLGKRVIPVNLIRGFRRGMGTRLVYSNNVSGNEEFGAILVADEAAQIKTEGGLAEKAGEVTAVAADKAHHAIEAAKPKVNEAAAVAGQMINEGAKATGRQLQRAKGMFAEFKNEFDKASGKIPESGKKEVPDHSTAPVRRRVRVIKGATHPAKPRAAKPGTASSQAKASPKPDDSAVDVGRKMGEHLKAAGGMFAAFKDEFDKAMNDDK